MSDETLDSPDRRKLVGFAALALAAGASLAGAARAEPTTPKADVKYQFTPNGAHRCGLCASFVAPAAGGSAPGACKIVQGPIPQDGWCVLFSPR